MRITESYLRNVIRTTLKGVLNEMEQKHRFDDSPDEPLPILKDLLEITQYYEQTYEESEGESYYDVHEFRQQIQGFIQRLTQSHHNDNEYKTEVFKLKAIFDSLTSTLNERRYIEKQLQKLESKRP